MKVTADAEVLPLSFALVESLLHSDAVAGEAARATRPTGHGSPDAYFDMRPLEELASPDVGSGPSDIRTVLFELRVHLDRDVGPVAREFGKALVENLRAELQKAFTAHHADLRRQLEKAEEQRKTIRDELESFLRRNTFTTTEEIPLDPANQAVYQQLDRVVDLSMLTPQTPAGEAFEVLRNSVQPPLNLVVLWRDLTENAYIDVTSPIEFDGPSSVRLGTALKSMLSGLSDPLASSNKYLLSYVVDGGAVIVATRLGLPAKRVETRVYELPPLLRAGGQAPELAALIRETIAPESWHDSGHGRGEGMIAAAPDGRLIVSQSGDVHIKIRELLTKVAAESSITLPGEKSQETLARWMESLMSYREQLERELDVLLERQAQIARERDEKSRRSMEETLRATSTDLFMVTETLRQIHEDMAEAGTAGPHAEELQRALGKIKQCMIRCNETPPMRSDLGWEFLPPDGEVNKMLAERIAAKQKNLREVGRRIAETQRVTTGTGTFDAELSRARWMAVRCEQADARIHDLKARIASLRPCIITIIGELE